VFHLVGLTNPVKKFDSFQERKNVISRRKSHTMKKFLIVGLLFLCIQAHAIDTIDSLKQALTTAKGDLMVKTLNELFRAYQESDPVIAVGYAREALALASEIEDKKGMAAAYNNLGISYRMQGALDRSLEYYLRSLRLYSELQNKEGIGTTKNNIATIYSLKKDYGQAMKYFEESYALFTELGDKRKIVGSLNNLGNLNSDLQLYEQAYKYYTQAYQLSEQAGEPLLDPVSNIGNLFFKQGNNQRAVEFYEKAIAMAEKENNLLSVLTITNNLGEVFTKAGQPARALPYLEKALGLSNELQAFIYEPNIHRNLAANFYRLGKHKEAYESMVKYDLARERVYGEESSRKIAQMEMALRMAEKEKEMEKLKMDDEIKTLQLHRTRLVIFLTIMAIVLVLAGLNLFYGRKKSKSSQIK
jgi:tetratricopeptide (TPR) repeat protein